MGGGGGGVGGPWDFSVSPSPFGLDFGTLDFRLGLDNNSILSFSIQLMSHREVCSMWAIVVTEAGHCFGLEWDNETVRQLCEPCYC